jgi:hypothetical protein
MKFLTWVLSGTMTGVGFACHPSLITGPAPMTRARPGPKD